MEDLIGVYGILDRDHWPEAPFQLLDGGVEIRWKEPYAFHNAERGTYSGWLMQYTLSGTGWFEKNGKTYEMSPGKVFRHHMGISPSSYRTEGQEGDVGYLSVVRSSKGRKQNKWNEKHSNRALAFFCFRQDVPSASEMYGNFRIW